MSKREDSMGNRILLGLRKQEYGLSYIGSLSRGMALGAVAVMMTATFGCSDSPTQVDSLADDQPADNQVDESPSAAATDASGTLEIRANGEDFVRQGFVSKDGWEIEFDHVYVTLADITASQSDPPFEPGKGELVAQQQAKLSEPVTVDLAAGDESAEPVLVGEITSAPAGRYNALSWALTPATEGPSAGYPLMLVGSATKADTADATPIDFQMRLSETYGFTCGDFVGDTRKGILTADKPADLEATFHFDHIFGDADAPATDEINTGALGFEPIAQLAEEGVVDVDSEQLEQSLSASDYQTLQSVLPSLGHVGEGHCELIE
ncbi:hypothetical protein S7335_2801 [Synechococcus sp. PCC 7335]|nr:hypothetical protein S7335_2801 [Synechococcus sp. PCC 7335]